MERGVLVVDQVSVIDVDDVLACFLLPRVFAPLSVRDWEQVRRLGVGYVALLSIDRELMTEAEHLSLTECDLLFFPLLKLFQLENAAEAFDLYLFASVRWNAFVGLWHERAVFDLVVLAIAPFLCNPCHLGLLLGFEVLGECFAVASSVLGRLLLVLLFLAYICLGLECAYLILLLL